MDYRIFPPQDLLQARAEMPLSKSESNRALMISALTPGSTLPARVAECDDTRAMTRAIATLGAAEINVGAAGTAMRFITALAAVTPGTDVVIDGSERMRQRPIKPLVDALRACGASVEYMGTEGFPPLRVAGGEIQGGEVTVDASISSQFISALMMAAPCMKRGLHIIFDGDPVSLPYINLTADMMTRAGARLELDRDGVTIEPTGYRPTDWNIGGDWSAASYWYELESLTSGFITLDGLDAESAQPDRQVARIFSDLAVVTEWEGEDGGIDLMASPELSPRMTIDLSGTPDLAQTVIVTCAMAGVPFHITGLDTLRIKETDRIQALHTELLKAGIVTDISMPGCMGWDGSRCPIPELPEFDTYNDHRMAMSLAPVAVYIPGIVIKDADVVSKSYPEYWEQMRRAGFLVADASMPREEMQKLIDAHTAYDGTDDYDS
ncbi:MAG: 3-phosphoshikimate 1-carboxyvinyltransferase [Muribaculaceae bacterium]|nr:3-phosphoshikimate 1-carboxyvinyltransferase [Muribaculaceae bacterium]